MPPKSTDGPLAENFGRLPWVREGVFNQKLVSDRVNCHFENSTASQSLSKVALRTDAPMTVRPLLALLAFSMVAASVPARADRMLDPLTLPPRARQAALYGPLGRYDAFGSPASPGCRWSRIQTPTAQGVRWMLLETCSSLGTQAH